MIVAFDREDALSTVYGSLHLRVKIVRKKTLKRPHKSPALKIFQNFTINMQEVAVLGDDGVGM